MEKNINKIADIIGEDLGKVKDDAIGEIRRGIENVEYACGIGEILKENIIKISVHLLIHGANLNLLSCSRYNSF